MSDTPPFICPVCGEKLKAFIRIRNNEHVLYCPNQGHAYVEGAGEDFGKALEKVNNRKGETKQQVML